jgi:hypothetical protein
MTKLNKKEQSKNVHLHNEDANYQLLDKFLPDTYASEAVRRLKVKNIEVSKSVVRNVRNGRNSAFKIQILSELVDMAKAVQTASEKLNTITT